MLSQQNSSWPNPFCRSVHSIGEKMRNVEGGGGEGGRCETEQDRMRQEMLRE